MERKPDAIDAPSSPIDPLCDTCGSGRGVPFRITLSHAAVHVDVRCSHCHREWQVSRPRIEG
jgi:hypothetical protein